MAVLVCFLPFVALGPYSFVRVHDNGDSVLPFIINLANQAEIWGGSGFWSWFPFQATGVPTFAQGMINLYQIPFFGLAKLPCREHLMNLKSLSFAPVWASFVMIKINETTSGWSPSDTSVTLIQLIKKDILTRTLKKFE